MTTINSFHGVMYLEIIDQLPKKSDYLKYKIDKYWNQNRFTAADGLPVPAPVPLLLYVCTTTLCVPFVCVMCPLLKIYDLTSHNYNSTNLLESICIWCWAVSVLNPLLFTLK